MQKGLPGRDSVGNYVEYSQEVLNSGSNPTLQSTVQSTPTLQSNPYSTEYPPTLGLIPTQGSTPSLGSNPYPT